MGTTPLLAWAVFQKGRSRVGRKGRRPETFILHGKGQSSIAPPDLVLVPLRGQAASELSIDHVTYYAALFFKLPICRPGSASLLPAASPTRDKLLNCLVETSLSSNLSGVFAEVCRRH